MLVPSTGDIEALVDLREQCRNTRACCKSPSMATTMSPLASAKSRQKARPSVRNSMQVNHLQVSASFPPGWAVFEASHRDASSSEQGISRLAAAPVRGQASTTSYSWLSVRQNRDNKSTTSATANSTSGGSRPFPGNPRRRCTRTSRSCRWSFCSTTSGMGTMSFFRTADATAIEKLCIAASSPVPRKEISAISPSAPRIPVVKHTFELWI